MVRGSGITPTDPYLERCWLPMVGPSTVALVRHVADLTAESGEARLPLNDLSRLLGLGAADVPSRNNKLVRTLARAEQFGLAFTRLGVPGEQVTFGIHDHVALVPARLLDRLPEVARQWHVAAVVRDELLDVSSFDVGQSLDTGPLEEISELTCGFAVRLDRLRRQVAGTQRTPHEVVRASSSVATSQTSSGPEALFKDSYPLSP